MKLLSIAILLSASFSTAVRADQPWIGHYLCVEEASAGLSFDASTGWRGAIFKPDGKFILTLVPGNLPDPKLTSLGMESDNATITPVGTDERHFCAGHTDMAFVGIYKTIGIFECETDDTDYHFDLNSLRFLDAYFTGYILGSSDTKHTPLMSGGTCTKID